MPSSTRGTFPPRLRAGEAAKKRVDPDGSPHLIPPRSLSSSETLASAWCALRVGDCAQSPRLDTTSTCANALDAFRPFRPVRAGGTIPVVFRLILVTPPPPDG